MLDRYELLYEAGLVAEAGRAAGPAPAGAAPGPPGFGAPLALDHRRILATALGRLRGKLKYRPLVFELLPEAFTLLQLQRTVETLAGVRLHKQNFRRLVERGALVEGTGRVEPATGGPARRAVPLPPRGAARASRARGGAAGPAGRGLLVVRHVIIFR